MLETQTSVPPHVQIIQMGTACWVSQIVCTAANIRLADHLAGGPKSAADLAAVTGTNPRALHRFMRTLASLGILTWDEEDERFALTPLGDALKSDAPGSARSTVLAMAGPWFWRA
jgi:DNA-binding IclR family transcriptional regulator